MKLKAINKAVIVKQHPEENVSGGGIVIKDQRTHRTGEIVSVGPECEYYKIGDEIIYVIEAGYPIVMNEGTEEEETYHYIFDEKEIYVRYHKDT